jgi:hypothetical protein
MKRAQKQCLKFLSQLVDVDAKFRELFLVAPANLPAVYDAASDVISDAE